MNARVDTPVARYPRRRRPPVRAGADRGRARGVLRAGGDRGQAAIMVLVVAAAMTIVLATALVEFGGHLIERGRAQHAADAAALAGLEGGRSGSDELARRNGAVLVSWVRGPGPDEVTVVVRVGDSTATARATNALS